MDGFNTWMCLLCRCHLYTVSVWSSVSLWLTPQKLIRLCGEILAAPTENEEIQFLCIVCAKLKQDPYLVNFFLEVSMMSIRFYHKRQQGCLHWAPNALKWIQIERYLLSALIQKNKIWLIFFMLQNVLLVYPNENESGRFSKETWETAELTSHSLNPSIVFFPPCISWFTE